MFTSGLAAIFVVLFYFHMFMNYESQTTISTSFYLTMKKFGKIIIISLPKKYKFRFHSIFIKISIFDSISKSITALMQRER